MLFRTKNGKLVEIERKNYYSDSEYYLCLIRLLSNDKNDGSNNVRNDGSNNDKNDGINIKNILGLISNKTLD